MIRPLYLFNVPENLARAAMEHKVLRPARGRVLAMFCSGVDPDAVGGFPGTMTSTSICPVEWLGGG